MTSPAHKSVNDDALQVVLVLLDDSIVSIQTPTYGMGRHLKRFKSNASEVVVILLALFFRRRKFDKSAPSLCAVVVVGLLFVSSISLMAGAARNWFVRKWTNLLLYV